MTWEYWFGAIWFGAIVGLIAGWISRSVYMNNFVKEELTYKKRFEDLQDRLKSPLDEIMEGRLVLEYEKNNNLKNLEKEIKGLREFRDNFGKNDFEKSILILLDMFKEISRQNKKLELTEKNRFLLLKENLKLKSNDKCMKDLLKYILSELKRNPDILTYLKIDTERKFENFAETKQEVKKDE